jgi:GDP-fucose transporter C1
LGSLLVSIFSIYTKKTLPYVNHEVWLLSYYNNVYSVFLFIPLIFFAGEFDVILNYQYLDQPWFWGVMTIGGVFGFAIGFLTSLQIKVTSALTSNISGTAKACAQTLLATSWYSETKSFLWWTSNFIVLIGSFLYAKVKQVEMAAKHRAQESSEKV